ncbi:MAG: TrkA family potassium uptake protein [Spirochaetota bacterium]|nr:TrkA family potassium uptake protein [Spirochaetota bacterium]
MKKKFFVIGLGNFGFSLAKTLEGNGCEVLGIDTSRELVERSMDYLSHAVIGDASNKDTLKSLMETDFDGAIVSIGHDMSPSILVSLYLLEFGIERIIVRAMSEEHGKILNLIGISEVIYPETEMAVRLANKLSKKNAVDYLPLDEDYSIIEAMPPKSFWSKSLKELNITSRFNCQVIALKYSSDKLKREDAEMAINSLKIPPKADDIITENSIMILIGKNSDIERFLAIK